MPKQKPLTLLEEAAEMEAEANLLCANIKNNYEKTRLIQAQDVARIEHLTEKAAIIRKRIGGEL